jgi:hypothetical protein
MMLIVCVVGVVVVGFSFSIFKSGFIFCIIFLWCIAGRSRRSFFGDETG